MFGKWKLLPLLLISGAVSANECSYSFSMEDGDKFSLDNIAQFVTDEIRPHLQQDNEILYLNIHEDCGDTAKKTTIGMNAQNYYLLTVNRKPLPDNVVRYNSQTPLVMGRDKFIQVLAGLSEQRFMRYGFYEPSTYPQLQEFLGQQNSLKYLAFVFAEAARFERAELAVKKIFEEGCTASWHEFDFMLHNWGSMSGFVKKAINAQKEEIEKGQDVTPDMKIAEPQYVGGQFRHLYAPITLKQEYKFIKALESKTKYEGKLLKFYDKSVFNGINYNCEG